MSTTIVRARDLAKGRLGGRGGRDGQDRLRRCDVPRARPRILRPGLRSPRRRTVQECMAQIAAMGERFSATNADALVVVADDHLHAFSFNAVPAMCVRIGRDVQRMSQDHAEAFDKVLEHMPERYPLHEALAGAILEQGLEAGFDLAMSWEAPIDHAFLSPVNTMHGARPIPPLVPIWVNCFVAPH